MAFIDYIPFDKASEALQKLYRKFGGKDNTPANILRISGINPKALEGHIALFRGVTGTDMGITRLQQEMIAVVVSGINQCHY
jgi:alkylhydroperoxidase family enzyme